MQRPCYGRCISSIRPPRSRILQKAYFSQRFSESQGAAAYILRDGSTTGTSEWRIQAVRTDRGSSLQKSDALFRQHALSDVDQKVEEIDRLTGSAIRTAVGRSRFEYASRLVIVRCQHVKATRKKQSLDDFGTGEWTKSRTS